MITKLTTHSSFLDYSRALSQFEEIKTSGALSAGPSYGRGGYGQLPQEFRSSFDHATYAVYSYSTPIAWFANGEWFVPVTKYSVTTTRHQGKIITAVSQFTEINYLESE